jgi:two-component system, response regulator PdtaR
MAQSVPNRLPAILVVEDEVLVRIDLVDTIQEAGFPTFEADGADEAIRLMENHPEIQVLFTDIDMPGTMDGLKLSHYVRHRWPPVRIIITSGHVFASPDQMPDQSMFIAKPHQHADLQRLFRAIEEGGLPP